MRFWFARPVAVLAVVLAVPALAVAADLHETVSPATPVTPQASLREALVERAMLYELRAAFNVLQPDEVSSNLLADARALSKTASFEAQRSYGLQDLLAEGSYYIVELDYLVEAGGANWPTDRASSVYEKDAEAKLEDLKHRWVTAVADGIGDLRGILSEADLINAWTEGETHPTPALDHFSGIDALVDETLAKLNG
jgi:hypothetical protein